LPLLAKIWPQVSSVSARTVETKRHLVVGRRLVGGRLLLHRRWRATAREQVEHGQRIDAQEVGGHQGHRNRAQPDGAPAEAKAAAPAAILATAVFHVVAFAIAFPFHDLFSGPLSAMARL
jgi:hypothetical protein